MHFSKKLLELRKRTGMSQEQLASRLTVSRQTISKWELGESMPDAYNVVQVNKLFGVSTDYLLNESMKQPSLCSSPYMTFKMVKGRYINSLYFIY